MNPWTLNGVPFLVAPEDKYGFLYKLTNTITDVGYIGSKVFRESRDGRLIECWQDYFGSSNYVNAALSKHPHEHWTREILELHEGTTQDLHEREGWWQDHFDVLNARLPNGERAFYNRCRAGKLFYAHVRKMPIKPARSSGRHLTQAHKDSIIKAAARTYVFQGPNGDYQTITNWTEVNKGSPIALGDVMRYGPFEGHKLIYKGRDAYMPDALRLAIADGTSYVPAAPSKAVAKDLTHVDEIDEIAEMQLSFLATATTGEKPRFSHLAGRLLTSLPLLASVLSPLARARVPYQKPSFLIRCDLERQLNETSRLS